MCEGDASVFTVVYLSAPGIVNTACNAVVYSILMLLRPCTESLHPVLGTLLLYSLYINQSVFSSHCYTLFTVFVNRNNLTVIILGIKRKKKH